MATSGKKAHAFEMQKKLNHKENQKRRADLRKKIKSHKVTPDEKLLAMFALAKRNVDESASRYTRRCWKCGRPRGVYRRFGLCRCCIFEAMRLGWLVGVRKASW